MLFTRALASASTVLAFTRPAPPLRPCGNDSSASAASNRSSGLFLSRSIASLMTDHDEKFHHRDDGLRRPGCVAHHRLFPDLLDVERAGTRSAFGARRGSAKQQELMEPKRRPPDARRLDPVVPLPRLTQRAGLRGRKARRWDRTEFSRPAGGREAGVRAAGPEEAPHGEIKCR
jgi:hypothetical protein